MLIASQRSVTGMPWRSRARNGNPAFRSRLECAQLDYVANSLLERTHDGRCLPSVRYNDIVAPLRRLTYKATKV